MVNFHTRNFGVGVKVQKGEDFNSLMNSIPEEKSSGILLPRLDMQDDDKYMQLALKLAERGKGRVDPNPLVGTVILKDGKIVGKGYHAYFGGAHAEIKALREAGKDCRGAALYVNLEPCVHFGKTPPCVPKIVKAGIKKVVIGILDPNPLNSGRGIKALKKAGIEVTWGIEAEKARKLNEKFIRYIKETGIKVKCLRE